MYPFLYKRLNKHVFLKHYILLDSAILYLLLTQSPDCKLPNSLFLATSPSCILCTYLQHAFWVFRLNCVLNPVR